MQLKLKLTVAAAIAAIAGVAAAQEVVRIGHVAPISGAQAHYGKDNENGSRMAIEELNAQGVEIGGKKVKFELLAEDDAISRHRLCRGAVLCPGRSAERQDRRVARGRSGDGTRLRCGRGRERAGVS